jgi:two-component system response regulator DevR
MDCKLPLRVFIVDDAADMRERLEGLIGAIGGIRIAGVAARADAAIEGILDTRPDLAVVDVSLAHGTGFDVLRAIGKQAPATQVCMLSNAASEPYRRRAAELGAVDFFDKTLELEALRDFLAACATDRLPARSELLAIA